MSTSTERSATLNPIVDSRMQVYGDPIETFVNIAKVWSGILGIEVNPTDVPLCMVGMKLVRTTQAPDYSDNSDDVDGYMDIFRQLVGPDMIHARSVDEYVAQRTERDRDEAAMQESAETDRLNELSRTAREGARLQDPLVTAEIMGQWNRAVSDVVSIAEPIPKVFVVDAGEGGISDVRQHGTDDPIVSAVPYAEASATAAALNATLAYRHGYCNKCKHPLVNHDSLSCEGEQSAASRAQWASEDRQGGI